MKVKAEVTIDGTKEAVWQAITDIEKSVDIMQAIEEIEVLEKPGSGLVGLKWRETRTMFGKESTEVMWITDAVENVYYDVRSEGNGAIYNSKLQVKSQGDSTYLSMEFGGEPVNTFSKIMVGLTGFIFKGATQKALQEDLNDVKNYIENSNGNNGKS